MIYSHDFHSAFTTNSKWQVVVSEKNNNLSDMFKLKSITIYHLWFVVKILWT